MAGRFVLPLSNLFNASGNVLANGTLTFYQTATSTPLDTYSDFALTVANTNPVTLDANGLPEAEIFLKAQAYKVVAKTSAGTIIATYDPVWAAPGLTDSNTFTKTQIWAKGADIVSAATLVPGTDGNFFDVTENTGPITAITVAAGTLFMLHMDSTPTFTHHATNLNFPDGVDFTATAGDRLVCFATAANQIEILAVPRRGVTLATEQATTSGTSIDFTSIPAWVKKITLGLVGVSTDGTDVIMVQIGDAGGIEATGYLGAASTMAATVATANATGAFSLMVTNAAAAVHHGHVVLTLENAAGFTWACSSLVARSDATSLSICAGTKSLTAALDRVRLTTLNGTDTFDAGVVNILYE